MGCVDPVKAPPSAAVHSSQETVVSPGFVARCVLQVKGIRRRSETVQRLVKRNTARRLNALRCRHSLGETPGQQHQILEEPAGKSSDAAEALPTTRHAVGDRAPNCILDRQRQVFTNLGQRPALALGQPAVGQLLHPLRDVSQRTWHIGGPGALCARRPISWPRAFEIARVGQRHVHHSCRQFFNNGLLLLKSYL